MCGIVGVFGSDRAGELAYQGLYQLQHRGQDSAGIVTADGEHWQERRGLGLLRDAVDFAELRGPDGTSAIGHVRYRTAGEVSTQETQPFVAETRHGRIAVAHNGNFPMAAAGRQLLMARGAPVITHSDTEVAVHFIAQAKGVRLTDAIKVAFAALDGAYAMLVMAPGTMVGFRDPYGFRPLFWGRRGKACLFASETCALTHLGVEEVHEVRPGTGVIADADGVREEVFAEYRKRRLCAFEKIYISRPDSVLDGADVSQDRYALGFRLAEEFPADADIVIPVLDSGQWAALGYAERSGIPYRPAMNRNHYVDRTFIKPEESLRDLAVAMKHSITRAWVRGQRVVLVDDSIIRAVTMKRTIRLIRSAGAKEIHVRVSSPPVVSPCFYGVDMRTKRELYAAEHGVQGVREYLGADSLEYLSREGMLAAFGDDAGASHCVACFTGEYPTPVPKF
ncbi:MAG TPA: amidophosphoribosyltransferase [Candidatus Paceibacterota bacterium]|nr:amidophosphoribosyltransferase [Candidatus Paceibacterota bacterium]